MLTDLIDKTILAVVHIVMVYCCILNTFFPYFVSACTYCRMIRRSLHQSLVPHLRIQNQLTSNPQQNHQRPPRKPLQRPNHLRWCLKLLIFSTFCIFASIVFFFLVYETNILTVLPHSRKLPQQSQHQPSDVNENPVTWPLARGVFVF